MLREYNFDRREGSGILADRFKMSKNLLSKFPSGKLNSHQVWQTICILPGHSNLEPNPPVKTDRFKMQIEKSISIVLLTLHYP